MFGRRHASDPGPRPGPRRPGRGRRLRFPPRSPLLGFSTDGAGERAGARSPLRRLAQRRRPARLDAALTVAPSPRRLAVRQGERRIHGGPLPLLGLPDPDRAVQGPLPDAQDAPAGDGRLPPASRRASPSRPSPGTRPPARPPSSSRSTTPTRSTATSPASWSTSTTACRRTTRSSQRRGIDVKGKIVIARYGGSWRGIKPKVAAEHGAIGCIIYSDPRDDGYFQGDVYPKGGYRTDQQRPARLGGGHAALLGRSADPGRRRHRGRQAARRQGRADDDQDPRAADLLRRRPAAARGARRPDGARRTGAARCRSPTTSAPARPASTSSWRSTGT